MIAQLCLLCVCWHWLSEIGLIDGNTVTSEPCWVAQLTNLRDRLPSRGMWTCSRSGSMRLNKVKASSKVLHLGGGIPSINTGWGMSEIKPVLLWKTWGFWWRRSWRWACNVHSHNWIMVQGGKMWFFSSQWTFRLHTHLVEHHPARQSGKSFLFDYWKLRTNREVLSKWGCVTGREKKMKKVGERGEEREWEIF